jgi:hypothetical protein
VIDPPTASHLAWDNIVNQMHFATVERVAQLLRLVETGSSFAKLLQSTPRGQLVVRHIHDHTQAIAAGMARAYEGSALEAQHVISSSSSPVRLSDSAGEVSSSSGASASVPLAGSILASASANAARHAAEKKVADTGDSSLSLRAGQAASVLDPSSSMVGGGGNTPEAVAHASAGAAASSTAALLEAENPTGREGINYLDGDEGGAGGAAALGIFSVDERGQFQNKGEEGGREEVQLYALMALINMSYHNPPVHDLVSQTRGVETILHLLGSPAFDVRKAAIFCLGNVVTGHRVSAMTSAVLPVH